MANQGCRQCEESGMAGVQCKESLGMLIVYHPPGAY